MNKLKTTNYKNQKVINTDNYSKIINISKIYNSVFTRFIDDNECHVNIHKIDNKLYVTIHKDKNVNIELKVLNFRKIDNQQNNDLILHQNFN
jgi:hypothetical protein